MQKVAEKCGLKKLLEHKLGFYLYASKKSSRYKKVFIFYLTKVQQKQLEKNINECIPYVELRFTNEQLVKTFKEVVRINSEIYRYLQYMKVDRFHEYNKPKPKTSQPKQ